MKINRVLLKENVPNVFEEDIDFSSVQFDATHIKKIECCHAKATAFEYGEVLHIDVEIKAKVIGICSYTLEDVELDINAKDDLEFTDNEDDDGCYLVKGPLIDLDEYILGILLANVPVRIVKKGAKLPDSGNGYRVLTQDEYQKEQENAQDPRWDALNDLEFDEK